MGKMVVEGDESHGKNVVDGGNEHGFGCLNMLEMEEWKVSMAKMM